jgi:hypothetical protein
MSTADETVVEFLLLAASGNNEPNEERLERFREAAEIATVPLQTFWQAGCEGMIGV